MKNALVVSSGGAHGAFAVGAIDYLVNEYNLSFSMISGTSTGALIAPLVATGDIQALLHFYQSVRTANILEPRPALHALSAEDAFNSTAPLRSLVEETITAKRTASLLQNEQTPRVAIVTVNLNLGQTIYFHTGHDFQIPRNGFSRAIEIRDREVLIQAMMASSAIPIFLQPYQVRSDDCPLIWPGGVDEQGEPIEECVVNPDDWYIDGGVREISPVDVMIENGATDVYVIALDPQRLPEEEYPADRAPSILSSLARIISIFLDEVLEGDLRGPRDLEKISRYIAGLREELTERFDETTADDILSSVENPFGTQAYNVHVIRPKIKLPGGGRTFEPEDMSFKVHLGREAARAYIEKREREDRPTMRINLSY